MVSSGKYDKIAAAYFLLSFFKREKLVKAIGCKCKYKLPASWLTLIKLMLSYLFMWYVK